jgi:hypothetical protein
MGKVFTKPKKAAYLEEDLSKDLSLSGFLRKFLHFDTVSDTATGV